jgi:hypothetical protein
MRKRNPGVCVFVLFSSILLGIPAGALAQPSETKVAVVTLTVNNFGGALHWGQGDMLIPTTMGEMLNITESALAGYWTVKPATEFVTNDDYRALSIGQVKSGLFGPTVNEQAMPSFTEKRNEVVKGVLEKSTAQKLVSLLEVDAVVLVYSEWAVVTGSFVPTSKPLAKNCLSMYDKSGKQLFYGREDVQGKKTLGAGGHVTLNDETIHHWSEAYSRGLDAILKKYSKKLK